MTANILTPAASEEIFYSSGVSWQQTALAFDGATGYVSIPTDTRLNLRADFTIEIEVLPTNITVEQVVAGKFIPGTSGFWSWRIWVHSDGSFCFDAGSAPANGKDIANAVSIGPAVLGVFNKLAICRQGNTYRAFNNGVLISTWTSALAPYSDPLTWPYMTTTPILIGYRGADYFDCWLAGQVTEFRISQIARYTAAYTPALTTFAWDKYTALLMHFDEPIPVQTNPYQLEIRRVEVIGILDRILDAISASFLGSSGAVAYPLREAVGDVRANGATYIQDKALSGPMLLCFTTALAAGTTLAQLNTILQAIEAETPVSLISVLVVQMCARFCLSTMARLLAATTFVSRTDADAALDLMSAAFDPAIEEAADEHDSGNYQALITLQGAVTRDLVARSLLLPNRVAYEFFDSMPTLWIAQRVYQDGSRYGEIITENHVVNPVFPLRDLRLLSQ